MRLGFSQIAVIAALVFMAAFASAPWFAFRALRSAALNQDAPALAELIDYGSVRSSLRAQLGPDPAAQTPAPDIWTDPLGAVRHALQGPLLQPPPAVEAYLTPAALSRLTEGRPAAGPAAAKPPFPAIIYWDVHRCRIAVTDHEAPGGRTVFTWQRRGLFEWKLVQIRLPTETSRR